MDEKFMDDIQKIEKQKMEGQIIEIYDYHAKAHSVYGLLADSEFDKLESEAIVNVCIERRRRLYDTNRPLKTTFKEDLKKEKERLKKERMEMTNEGNLTVSNTFKPDLEAGDVSIAFVDGTVEVVRHVTRAIYVNIANNCFYKMVVHDPDYGRREIKIPLERICCVNEGNGIDTKS